MATTYTSASQQAHGRPPPPYAGAPPVPAGVNAQQWQAGFWKFNPAFQARKGQQQVHVPWVPSRHWIPQQQQQQQPSFNPYKRQPRAPSAEYLATKLSDNPLGLMDMVPISIEEYYRQGQPEPVVHTPWIWNPSTLADDDDEQPQQQQPREPGDYTEKRELQPTFSASIVRTPEHYRSPLARHATMPAAQSWKLPMLSDRPAISDEPASMFAADADLGALLSPLVLATPALPPTGLAPRTRHPQPVPATRSLGTIPERRPRRPEQQPREQPKDARALTYPAPEQRLGTRHTTALYVPPASTPPHRTGSGPPSPYGPSPYVTPHATPPGSKEASPGPRTVRRASEQDNRRTSESHQDDTRRVPEPYAQDPARRASEPHAHGQDTHRRAADPPPRANPLPPPPQPSAYTAPPLMPSRSASAVLAPAPGPAPTHERRARTSSASAAAAPHTPPAYGGTPPHSASASASAYAQAQYAAERTAPHSASASASAYAQARHAVEHTPPHSAPAHAQGAYGAPHTPPHGVRPAYGTPTHSHSAPTRPTHVHAHSTPTHPAHAHTAPAPAQAYPSHAYPAPNQNQTQTQNPPHPAREPPQHPSPPRPTPLSPALPRRPPRVRRGYWNRRGDHLTPSGFLVYAPPHLAFPDELATYPPPHEGYQDDRGAWCRWVARPELRESLPREGRAAERPYESFVVYVDQPGAQ